MLPLLEYLFRIFQPIQYDGFDAAGSGDVAPPSGGRIDAETARNISTTGYRAWLDMTSAFYGMLELDRYRQEQEEDQKPLQAAS